MSPTGYTASVAPSGDREPIDFQEFVWSCARAFGALVTMRDAPPDAPIPLEFEPSAFYRESVRDAREALREFRYASDAERREMHHEAQERRAVRQEELRRERGEREQRYRAMLDRVEAWEPPTPEHDGLKEFMAEQLRESILFDCRPYEPPGVSPFEEWEEETLEQLEAAVDRAVRNLREEKERARERTEWVQALRESVGEPPQGVRA